MINRDNILNVNGIYTSLLYKDWVAVEYIEMRDNKYFRIRLPYKTRAAAVTMADYLKRKSDTPLRPDYAPVIHIMEQVRVH